LVATHIEGVVAAALGVVVNTDPASACPSIVDAVGALFRETAAMSAPDAPTIPTSTLEVRSTVGDDATVTVHLRRSEIAPLGDDDVLVRVGAAPINPSDLGGLFAGADLRSVIASELDGLPAVVAPLSPGAFAASAGRLGRAMPAGNEGGGTVVGTGSSSAAEALAGRVVGFLSGNSYAEYRVLNLAQCLAMPDGVTPAQAAAAFVNPLTSLGMVETMRLDGHRALVHTVGASNLGLMLQRVCTADGVGLVNIVRRPEHVALLADLGAEHVCDSSSPTFEDDLVDAVRATGATIAFDAIGGGELASTILRAMEHVAGASAGEFSRYGSGTHKQVYIYGGLDRSPTVLHRDFGMSWSMGGWLLMPFLARIGPDAADRLRRRVADEITTTFASSYGAHLSLVDVVDPDHVRRYGRMASGDKALVVPEAAG
jgi:NADPH2:quinone reductase